MNVNQQFSTSIHQDPKSTCNVCSRPFGLLGSNILEPLSTIESRLLPASESRLLISRSRRDIWPRNCLISRSA